MLGEAEIQAVTAVFESGNLTQGEETQNFEIEFAEFVGSGHAVAVSSATAGLHLSLLGLGIGPGDEVIVADFTWPATGNVIVACGATPVFVDISLSNFGTTADEVSRAITSRTKAIMIVHAFGLMCDLQPILKLASQKGLKVIEDAACAIGSRSGEKHAGVQGDAGVFSFHPRKLLTTGEGGMVVSSDHEFIERIRSLRQHGVKKKGLYVEFVENGFNYRMSDIQAAIGRVQLRKLPELVKTRRARAFFLAGLLESFESIRTPVEPVGFFHTFQSFVVLTDGTPKRDVVVSEMRAAGIEATLGTYAMHLQPAFQRFREIGSKELKNSASAFENSISLPLHGSLTETDLELIATQFEIALGSTRA